MFPNVRYLALAAFGLLLISSSLNAWESNQGRGPVRPQPTAAGSKEPLTYISKRTPAIGDTFKRRTIAYPSEEGANLGEGWDFLTNQRTLSSCIVMQPERDDKYLNATVRVRDASDEETLKVSLNAEFSGSFGGTIEGITAKIKATDSLKASHFLATTDLTFVAHASIESGVHFVAPPPQASAITLRPEMARLAKTDPHRFRERCGDGFVGTIGYGSDLYLLLHFHTLTRDDRLELSHQSKASVGFGDVFSASGSSKLRSTIERLVKRSALDISFVQRGGKIEKIPLTIEEARAVVQGVGKQDTQAPRRVYMMIVPYSDLPEWEGFYRLDSSDIREKALRYFFRLSSLYSEIMNIREDYYRDRHGELATDKYYYNYQHQLREERLSDTSDDVWEQIRIVDQILRLLDSPECSPRPVATAVAPGLTGTARRDAERVLLQKRNSLEAARKTCDEKVKLLVKRTDDFNDFKFWIELPVPLNTLSEQAINSINTKSTPFAERQSKYAHAVFSHWVERTDQIRCRLFFECLSEKERKELYGLILDSLKKEFPVNVTVSQLQMCIGQLRRPCRGIRHFGCGTDEKETARTMCQSENRGYWNVMTRGQPWEGNRCGYVVVSVACHHYQPLHRYSVGP